MRRTMNGQQMPNPAPCSSMQTTIPGSAPTGMAMMNPAPLSAIRAAPRRMSSRSIDSLAPAIIIVQTLQAIASAAMK